MHTELKNHPATTIAVKIAQTIFAKTSSSIRRALPVFLPMLAVWLGSHFHAVAGDKETLTQETKSPAQKPAWLSELSLAAKEGYDSNVYLSGADQHFMPAHTTTLKDRSSWLTTISPKIELNLAPLMGAPKSLETFSVSYAPDFVIYHDEPTESYNAHRVGTLVKGRSDAVSFCLENSFVYIDGDKEAPIYPGGYVSAYATAAPRERREQIQDRTKFFLRLDAGKWFIRPVASLLYYDMMTNLKNETGYQNYPDRYDLNGGVDLGYKITPQLAATLGYRYGHQFQEQFSWDKFSAPSDYQRVLFGIEGKPFPWLKTEIQAGPDFRDYSPNTPTHITPVDDKHPVKFYGEAALTADLTSSDVLAFKFRQFQWVSSVGRIPYQDTVFDLCYRRKISDKLRAEFSAKAMDADYTSANIASCQRDDWEYCLSATLTYAFDARTSVSAGYEADFGRNGYDNLPAAQLPASKREFTRQAVSFGFLVKF